MVCGAARSGTTMLDLMLGSAPGAFSTGEINRLFRPWRIHQLDPVCTCGDRNCPTWEGLKDIHAANFHAKLLSRPEISCVVDSSKELGWVLDSNVWAQANGIPVANVVIWKDPIDLSYSYWKRGSGVSGYRRHFLTYYERFLNLGLPFVALNYRQLVSDTDAALRELMKFIGMQYDDSCKKFWEKEHHHFFGSTGTLQQVMAGNSKIELKRDFPAEFVEAFAAESSWCEQDERYQKIAKQLEKYDISNSPNLTPTTIRRPREFWYYSHLVKDRLRKIYPDRRPLKKINIA
jgi:hypothetical protein